MKAGSCIAILKTKRYLFGIFAGSGIWRRFFELKEKEDEERIEEIAEILEEVAGVHIVRPASTEEAARARREFVQEHHRNLAAEGTEQSRQTSVRALLTERMRQHEDQQLNRPNLDVPIGNEYVTLPQ